jgi:hypothetical protein
MRTESTLRALLAGALLLIAAGHTPVQGQERSHPRLLTDSSGIDSAKAWVARYPWYRAIVEEHRAEIDRFIDHGPVYVSPLKQTYVFQMYTCPKHGVELIYDEFSPFRHRCPVDTNEVYSGGKYDMAWAGWYNRLLGTDPDSGMGWKGYFFSALAVNIVQMAIAFVILTNQNALPLNPQGFKGMSWDLALNTVVSFATNTNLQHYNGETTLSYFSQMGAIQFLQFTSAATGMCVMVAMVRAMKAGRLCEDSDQNPSPSLPSRSDRSRCSGGSPESRRVSDDEDG